MAEQSALYATIQSQPDVVRDALKSCDVGARQVAEILTGSRRVFLTGTGTNSHAAVVGEHLLRSVGVEAFATTNFDFATYPRPLRSDDAVIVLSHTGTTRYGRQVIEQARGGGARIIGITGQGSPMDGVDVRLEVSPHERSDTYTASYTAALAVLGLIAVRTGEALGTAVTSLQDALVRLPDSIAAVLQRQEDMRPVVERLAARQRLVLAGAGPNAVTAREGALKVKESSYLTAEGFELETFLHGGLQAVEPGDIAMVVVAHGPALERSVDAIRALRIIGTYTVVIADEHVVEHIPVNQEVQIVRYPGVPEPISPVLAVVPLQLLAAFSAELRGTNPDNFRYDEDRYKEAIESLTL